MRAGLVRHLKFQVQLQGASAEIFFRLSFCSFLEKQKKLLHLKNNFVSNFNRRKKSLRWIFFWFNEEKNIFGFISWNLNPTLSLFCSSGFSWKLIRIILLHKSLDQCKHFFSGWGEGGRFDNDIEIRNPAVHLSFAFATVKFFTPFSHALLLYLCFASQMALLGFYRNSSLFTSLVTREVAKLTSMSLWHSSEVQERYLFPGRYNLRKILHLTMSYFKTKW